MFQHGLVEDSDDFLAKLKNVQYDDSNPSTSDEVDEVVNLLRYIVEA